MKSLFTFLIYCCILLSISYGQNITFQVQGGLNLTSLSSFENQITIVDQGFVVPDMLTVSNSKEPAVVALSEASASVEPGFFVDLEAYWFGDWRSKWKLSSAAGLDYWRYNYDNAISLANTIFFTSHENMAERLAALQSESLSSLNGSYGEVETFYFEIQPVNVSLSFSQGRFSLQTGPVVSFKMNKNHENIAIKYNEGSEPNWEEIDDVYFASVYEFNDVLPGWQLGYQGALSDKVSAFLAAKYYFTPSFDLFSESQEYSVYKVDQGEIVDEQTKNVTHKAPLPLQFQAGISYNFLSVGKQKQ